MTAGGATIGLVDPCCPIAYDPAAMPGRGLGGTEATVARVVNSLSAEFRFRLFQNARTETTVSRGVELCPLAVAERDTGVAAIVVINSWKVACRLRRLHPDLPISLWLHVYPGRHNRAMGAALAAADITVICVSHSHAAALTRFLASGPMPVITHVYNPVDDALRPDDTRRDPRRLLYASSPHKGLAEVFSCFRALRDHQPDLALHVADPGYLAWNVGAVPDGVRFLGHLDQPRLTLQMRKALCLFYPQISFAETFGLVMAEANAVGTPVLAHRGLGANDEVVGQGELVDATDPAQILSRLQDFQRGAAPVTMPEAFRLAQVTAVWRETLHDMVATARTGGLEAAE